MELRFSFTFELPSVTHLFFISQAQQFASNMKSGCSLSLCKESIEGVSLA